MKYAIIDLEELKKMREQMYNTSDAYRMGLKDGVKMVAQSDCILSSEQTLEKLKEVFYEGSYSAYDPEGRTNHDDIDKIWNEFKKTFL